MKRILALIRKLATFGFRGVIDQVSSWPQKHRLRRLLLAHVQDAPPTPGVTVVAPLSGTTSLGKVMNDFVAKLKDAEIPHQTFDCTSPEQNDPNFTINRYTRIIGMLGTPALPSFSGVSYGEVIFWEFENGVASAYPHLLDDNKTVIAMSDFNATCYRHELPPEIPVVKINYPLVLSHTKDLLPSSDETRRRFGIPANAFAVFFNVGIGSNRKNPEGCIHAFAEAFADTPDAVLVFKVMHAKRFPDVFENLMHLAEELGIADRFITITDFISEEDIYALTNCCDCYLSLHRGEGFGLGIAEAMSLGKPVVVTNYSATTEFCNAKNALLVPFRMVKPELSEFDTTVYHHVTAWAEPDIHAAATPLRQLHDNPNLQRSIGAAAAKSIADQFSTKAFKASMERFLWNASNVSLARV